MKFSRVRYQDGLRTGQKTSRKRGACERGPELSHCCLVMCFVGLAGCAVSAGSADEATIPLEQIRSQEEAERLNGKNGLRAQRERTIDALIAIVNRPVEKGQGQRI